MNGCEMDVNDNLDSFSRNSLSLIFLTFLHQRPCHNVELQMELDELDHKLQFQLVLGVGYDDNRLIDSNIECDGGLETDGHSSQRSLRSLQRELFPQVQLELPVNAQENEGVREVAAEIIRIADELNHSIISQAAERLTKKLSSSPRNCWWNHLSQGVESLLQEVPCVQTEQAMMALTFSLVKAACELAPRLLWDLYNVLMQYISFARPR